MLSEVVVYSHAVDKGQRSRGDGEDGEDGGDRGQGCRGAEGQGGKFILLPSAFCLLPSAFP